MKPPHETDATTETTATSDGLDDLRGPMELRGAKEAAISAGADAARYAAAPRAPAPAMSDRMNTIPEGRILVERTPLPAREQGRAPEDVSPSPPVASERPPSIDARPGATTVTIRRTNLGRVPAVLAIAASAAAIVFVIAYVKRPASEPSAAPPQASSQHAATVPSVTPPTVTESLVLPPVPATPSAVPSLARVTPTSATPSPPSVTPTPPSTTPSPTSTTPTIHGTAPTPTASAPPSTSTTDPEDPEFSNHLRFKK